MTTYYTVGTGRKDNHGDLEDEVHESEDKEGTRNHTTKDVVDYYVSL